MNSLKRILLCVLLATPLFASPSKDLKQALSQYEAQEFDACRRSAEGILLSGRGEELEAALYLLVRVNLATGQSERASRGVNRLLDAFPEGVYAEYARFARAESAYLLDGMSDAMDDLQWCADSASDNRLATRARDILERRSEFDAQEYLFPHTGASSRWELRGSEHRPKVRLLLSFPDASDPAPAQLESAFMFAARQLDKFDGDVQRVGSALSAVQALDRAVNQKLDLIVFAGDEGSATSLALANADHEFPILKLTSTARSLASLSTGMVELLPSQETQALFAARYAGMELQIKHGIALTPTSDVGQAQKDGFSRCADFGIELDASIEYLSDANNIRPELYDVMAAPSRLERGEELVETVLSRKDRERLLGQDGKGEVSVPALPESDVGDEVFYFSLSSEQINNYCSQLGRLPKGMTLIGNSSWLDERSLLNQLTVTDKMLIVAPLLPFPSRHTELFIALDETEEFSLSAWQLLGIDAAEFVAAVFSRQFASGADFVEAARDVGHFSGSAVEVDISATGENRTARLLKFDGQDLLPIQ